MKYKMVLSSQCEMKRMEKDMALFETAVNIIWRNNAERL